jgi:hypothetical protein
VDIRDAEPEKETPVVVIVYKRPDLAKAILASVKDLKPSKLFVIADGPKSPAEESLCHASREVFMSLGWECDVIRIYSPVNLGLRNRVISGLDEVFSQVRSAIILEEDCQPSPSFFSFCHQLLWDYKADEKVALISGNYFGLPWLSRSRVVSSNHALIWGWATWSKTWWEFRQSLAGSSFELTASDLQKVRQTLVMNPYRRQLIKTLQASDNRSWAAYFASWVILENRISALPSRNLVRNIGFGGDATHTFLSTPDVDLPARVISLPVVSSIRTPTFLYDVLEVFGRSSRYCYFFLANPRAVRRFFGVWRVMRRARSSFD